MAVFLPQTAWRVDVEAPTLPGLSGWRGRSKHS